MALGERIKEARQRRGLTQEQLARRAGLTLNAYGDIERNVHDNPHVQSVIRIAAALDVPVSTLLGEEAEVAPLAEGPSTSPVDHFVDHLRGKEDAIPDKLARSDAAKKAAGPQRPPVAQIIERLGELPRVLWYIPEEERDEWREDLDSQYPDGYLEEDAPREIDVDRTTKVKALA